MADTKPVFQKISLDHWEHTSFSRRNLQVDVLRLDKMHPEISGNKWFKLKYFLESAAATNKKTLISFGGAYSNHLLALAAAAAHYRFSSIGFIRGEKPSVLSPGLLTAREYGMELRFLSRTEYRFLKNSAGKYNGPEWADALWIPEGGAGTEGVRGAEEIVSGISIEKYSQICCAVGTGTTLAGIINRTEDHQLKIGVSVLKGTSGYGPMDLKWIKRPEYLENVRMIHHDHFGGYAKWTKDLIDFMNQTFLSSGIPTDFVYTGKLFYSVLRMAEMNAFQPGSRILILHTGGLSGNRSLAPGLLQF